MRRIRIADLEMLVVLLNELTNNNTQPINDDNTWNIGTFMIDSTYGGHALHKVSNNKGAVEIVIHRYISKRELHDKIRVFIAGIYEGSND